MDRPFTYLTSIGFPRLLQVLIQKTATYCNSSIPTRDLGWPYGIDRYFNLGFSAPQIPRSRKVARLVKARISAFCF